MRLEGNLLKLRSLLDDPIVYALPLGNNELVLNDLLGKEIHLHFLNEIHCIRCGRKTSKSFAQGYCFPCFQVAPETEDCVLRPELCRAHEGIARDMEFARKHCLIDHYVYLAYTSGIKVGVTRSTQIPTRWIDQGATHAIKLAKTPNRYLAGCIEVALKAHYNDKTNWRKMLSFEDAMTDLQEVKKEAIANLSVEYHKYIVPQASPTHLNYPHLGIPDKLNSISLDKINDIDDTLVAIKGQYLIFESGIAFNVRKHTGYKIVWETL